MCEYIIKRLDKQQRFTLLNDDDLLKVVFDDWEELKENCEVGWQMLQDKGFVNIAGVDIYKVSGYVVQMKSGKNTLFDSPDGFESNVANLYADYDLAKRRLVAIMKSALNDKADIEKDKRYNAEIKTITLLQQNTTHKHITFVKRTCI